MPKFYETYDLLIQLLQVEIFPILCIHFLALVIATLILVLDD